VVTNLHACKIYGVVGDKMTVLFGYSHGKSQFESAGTIEKIGTYSQGPNSSTLDYCIIVLDKPAPKSITPLTVVDISIKAFIGTKGELSVIGYSGDIENGEVASISSNCEVTGEDEGLDTLKHNCDTMHGASGAPLIYEHNSKCYITALHRGSFLDKTPDEAIPYIPGNENMAVKTSKFAAVLKSVIANLPPEKRVR
jgi:V8-like Glu-specific endopeptidase